MKQIRTLILFILCLIIIVILIYTSSTNLLGNPSYEKIISPVFNNFNQSTKHVLSLFTKNIGQLIIDDLANKDGTYSIIVTDLKNHKTYSLNADHVYNSASLYKLWVMADTYQAIQKGRLEKDDLLHGTIEDLNKSFEIATEEAELKSGTIEMTVSDALNKAITISDNYSALLLTKKLGVTSINSFLKKQGMTHSKTSLPPVTTASDIALFYLRLYEHQLISPEASEEMIDLLKKQTINDRIPKYLPEGTSVAHKTGELGTIKHDAGIIFTKKGDYILVMLSDTDDPSIASKNMAILSKDIYKYFSTFH